MIEAKGHHCRLFRRLVKSILGFATQEDLETLARHINMLTGEFDTCKMNVQYACNQRSFASVLNQVDDRLNKVTIETRSLTDEVIKVMSDTQSKWLILEVNFKSNPV